MTEKRETTEMTDFGYYLSGLLKNRHFDNLTQYSERLREVGRGATPQMVSRYRRDARVPLWFIADSIEALELDERETDKLVDLWLDTLSHNERAMMDRLWRKKRPEQRDIRDLQDYERQREEQGGEDGKGGPPGDR